MVHTKSPLIPTVSILSGITEQFTLAISIFFSILVWITSDLIGILKDRLSISPKMLSLGEWKACHACVCRLIDEINIVFGPFLLISMTSNFVGFINTAYEISMTTNSISFLKWHFITVLVKQVFRLMIIVSAPGRLLFKVKIFHNFKCFPRI